MPVSFRAQLARPVVVIAASGIIATGTVAYALLSVNSRPGASYVHPQMTTITEEVSSTGVVKAAQAVDLSFQASGRIASTHYDVGSHVAAGSVLASLASADQVAQVEQAKANLAIQEAKLQSLQEGATSETVDLSQTDVTNAKASLAAAQQSIIQAAENAYVASDDAIHNRVDLMLTNPRTGNPTFNLQLSDSQAQIAILTERPGIEALLGKWLSDGQPLLTADPSSLDMNALVSTSRANLTQVGVYLDLISKALTEAIPTSNTPAATIQSYQSSISTARSNLSSALSALNTANTAFTSAQSGLATANAQLLVTTAPANSADIAAQQAAIAAVQASLDFAEAQLGKTAIVAPISGTITVDDARTGATASPGTPLISMISDSKFQIETQVSEADLSKVAVGNFAAVLLDAYQNAAPLAAHVIKIDPAADLSSGVASYKVTLQFDTDDSRVRSGMSGSIVITTHQKSSVLSIPSTAVIRNGTDTQVMKEGPSGDILAPVVLGISGGGLSEVVSGISASDTVRSFGNQ